MTCTPERISHDWLRRDGEPIYCPYCGAKGVMAHTGFARNDEVTVEGRPARVLRVDRLGLYVAYHDTGAVILIDPATAVKL
jgi:hypothetical protein